MNVIKEVFFNIQENRIRAGWRILIQFVLFMPLLVVFVILDHLLAGGLPKSALGGKDSILYPLEMFLAALISIWLVGRFLDRRKFVDFGLKINRAWWMDLGVGFIFGGLVITGIYLVMKMAGWVEITGFYKGSLENMPFAADLLIMLAIYIVFAANEEVQIRGFWIRNISEGLSFGKEGKRRGVLYAVVLTSLIFGAVHLGEEATVLSTFNLMFAGLLYALAFVWTGQLGLPLGFHIGWNFFQGGVFGFNVSGTVPVTSVLQIQQNGPVLWTGGAEFGPEAGLLGVGAHVVGLFLFVWWVKRRRGEVGVDQILVNDRIADLSVGNS
jgi:membrane protease YdiL (CAAX protease family)